MAITRPPEELDSQVPDFQLSCLYQSFTSLVRRRGGWIFHPALHRLGSSPSLELAVSGHKV